MGGKMVPMELKKEDINKEHMGTAVLDEKKTASLESDLNALKVKCAEAWEELHVEEVRMNVEKNGAEDERSTTPGDSGIKSLKRSSADSRQVAQPQAELLSVHNNEGKVRWSDLPIPMDKQMLERYKEAWMQ